MHVVKKLALMSGLMAMVIVGLTASAFAEVGLTKGRFVYGGRKYFRGKAENISFASFGQKKTPFLGIPYLAVENTVTRRNLDKMKSQIKISAPISIDWGRYTSADVNVGIKYLTVAGASAGFNHKVAKRAKLKLVKIYMHEGPLKTLLNNHAPGARKFMAAEGRRARIVSEVFVVMAAKLASKVSNCGSLSGYGTPDGSLMIELDTKVCNTNMSKIKIPADTTFAYGMHFVKEWNVKTRKVRDMEDDNVGPT